MFEKIFVNKIFCFNSNRKEICRLYDWRKCCKHTCVIVAEAKGTSFDAQDKDKVLTPATAATVAFEVMIGYNSKVHCATKSVNTTSFDPMILKKSTFRFEMFEKY